MTSLIEISIPSSVKIIKPFAFGMCCNLKKVTFESPCSLIKIDSALFDGCTSLTEFTVPSSVKNVRNHVFINCKNLKKVTFENPCIVEIICCCEEFEIPPSVTEIGEMIFANCSSLSNFDNSSKFENY